MSRPRVVTPRGRSTITYLLLVVLEKITMLKEFGPFSTTGGSFPWQSIRVPVLRVSFLLSTMIAAWCILVVSPWLQTRIYRVLLTCVQTPLRSLEHLLRASPVIVLSQDGVYGYQMADRATRKRSPMQFRVVTPRIAATLTITRPRSLSWDVPLVPVSALQEDPHVS